MESRDDAAQTRVAQRLYPTCCIAAATFYPSAHDRGGDDIGEPRQYSGKACALGAGLPLHRLKHRQDFRLPAQKRSDEHDLGHEPDERMHAAQVEFHAAAEDQRVLRPAPMVRAVRDRADGWAKRVGLEGCDVPARQIRCGKKIMGAAARQEHGIPRAERVQGAMRGPQKDRALSDEMELRPRLHGAEADAERRRDLNAVVPKTVEPHPQEQFAHKVDR
jgi:hypothetical protein